MNRSPARWWWGVCLVVCWPLIAHSDEAELRRFESTQVQMGVPFKLLLYAPDEAAAKGAFEAAFARVAQLNRILSDFDPDSELSHLSRLAPMAHGIAVSDPLWQVLNRSYELAERTDGAFDVTVGPYVRLWRRARRTREMPPADRLAEARAAVGYQKLKLDPQRHTAQLMKPNMRLDLGGIAIGYAVDEVLKRLKSRGVNRALVDASGDIGVSDPPPGKPGWIVGIMPMSAEGTPTRFVSLTNAAVTTTGDVFQHVDIKGARYSHIVDPRTGLGLTNGLGVAVVASDCMTADSLDTAVAVLGVTDGLKLIEETPGAAAFIVRPTDTAPATYQSQRFDAFVVSPDSPRHHR